MKTLRIMWKHMSGNRLIYLGAILCVGLATLTTISGPLVIRLTIDSVIGDEPLTAPLLIRPLVEKISANLWVPGILLVLITTARGLFIFLRGRITAIASENIAKNIRDTVFDHIQHLPYAYHKNSDTGDIMQRCTSDVETIKHFLGNQLVEMGNVLFMLLFSITIMLRANVRMTLISMTVIPIIFFSAIIFFRLVKKTFTATEEAEAELTTVIQENLTGIRVVRAFANQEYEIERFAEKNEVFRDKLYRLIWLLACYWSSSDFVAFLQIGIVMVVGAYYTAQGVITIGTMVLFSTYTGMLLWPVRHLGRILTDMGKALVAVERLEEILQEPKEELLVDGKEPAIHGEITFDNVSFGYEADQDVLKGISFSVLPGETVGILGHTGSGKSSLVHLLARLYDYNGGSITIDGVELRTIDKSWVRQNVAVVPQEPFLFAKTIKENIKIARDEVSDAELYKVCKEAAIHDVILNFDQGYETLVGERGVSVSGGQRQRIAIARALITQSPILIFDDSLSAVDTETDLVIRNALRNRAKAATTVLISHRVTSLAGADLILVLEDGKIVEQGTHGELMARNGSYKRIWDIQNELEAGLQT
ncbi:MAG: ABC transporter ATP-binding protein [Bacillota bacterium]|nr:ABC transporter ATP-binding protein [Bacillota bacterium]HHU61956.1 ABC transporter ATP-binding protein [Natronincola sp.]